MNMKGTLFKETMHMIELLVYGPCEGLDSLEYIHYSSCSAIQLFCCDAQVSIDKCKIAVTAIEY